MRLFLCAIVKDEISSLLEWIAYHRKIGVSFFYIADNGSKDGTRELLEAMDSAGILSFIDYPTDIDAEKPQLPAYQRLLERCSGDADMVAFLDADEYLLPMDGEFSLLPFVERIFSQEDVSAVALNWSIFGSGGALFSEDGLVIERFSRRAPQTFNVNLNFKSLVRPKRVRRFINPHYAELKSGRYVDASGADLVLNEKHGPGVSTKVLWQGARVNHYAVKSLEEFLVGKSRRGSAATHNRVKHKAYFQAHDRNDEECHMAAALAPLVRLEMERLQALVEPFMKPRPALAPEGWLKRMSRVFSKGRDV